jgi:short-subunit dehydrogenase
MKNLAGRRALVTGASIGIGADFARQLAARGCNLVIASRTEARLRALADELVAQYGVAVEVIAIDLAAPGAGQRLFEDVRARGLDIDVLVNNAGLGMYGGFADQSLEQIRGMLRLNIDTLTDLTHLFLPGMRQRGFGIILQVGSIASFMPGPLYAAYSGSKAYVLSLGEALNQELKGSGVSCTVLCPGVTATEFFNAAGQNNRYSFYQRLVMMPSNEVARIGIEAALRGKASVVPGLVNKLQVFGLRLSPRWFSRWSAHQAMKLR